jgi:hypothetical protein
VVISTAFILAAGQQLPDTVAAHFGLRGVANGFMPRDQDLVVMALLGSALPIATAGLTALAVRRAPRLPSPAFPVLLTAFTITLAVVGVVFKVQMNRAACVRGRLCG